MPPKKKEPRDKWVRSSRHGLGRGFQLERYSQNDGRKVPGDCDHTQFIDVDFPPTHGACLDCGCHFEYHTWNVVDSAPVLTDAQLDDHRDFYHKFWWDNAPDGTPGRGRPNPAWTPTHNKVIRSNDPATGYAVLD